MSTTEATVSQKVKFITSKLGPTLVAATIGLRDRRAISHYSENLQEVLNSEQKIRLDELLKIWNMVAPVEGDDIARAWFIGANPWLGDESAVTALREDRFTQVTAAARAMVEDTPSF